MSGAPKHLICPSCDIVVEGTVCPTCGACYRAGGGDTLRKYDAGFVSISLGPLLKIRSPKERHSETSRRVSGCPGPRPAGTRRRRVASPSNVWRFSRKSVVGPFSVVSVLQGPVGVEAQLCFLWHIASASRIVFSQTSVTSALRACKEDEEKPVLSSKSHQT
jgi:hypothetical protein